MLNCPQNPACVNGVQEKSCWTQNVAIPNHFISFSLPRVRHKSWLPDWTTGLFLGPRLLSHHPPHGVADKRDEGHTVGEATACSVGGLMGRLHPKTMALQWGWGLHDWPQKIMGPGGMFTRCLHTWYFTLQQGDNSHLTDQPVADKETRWRVLAACRCRSYVHASMEDPHSAHTVWAGWLMTKTHFNARPHTRLTSFRISSSYLSFVCIGCCSDINVTSLPFSLTITCVIGPAWPRVLDHKGANRTLLAHGECVLWQQPQVRGATQTTYQLYQGNYVLFTSDGHAVP